MATHIGQVIDLPVNQVVTRQDHLSSLAGLGQALDKNSVKQIQQALINLGYPLQGSADGVAGRTTKKAIELVEPKINAERKKAALARGGSWRKLETGGSPTADLLTSLYTNEAAARTESAPNQLYRATDEDKKAVRALWTASTTSGGSLVVGGSPNVPVQGPTAPPVTSGGVVDPMAPAGPGVMAKYEEWLKKQPIPEFLKNPYVAAGAVVVTAAALFFGVRALTKSEPAPVMAGLGEMDMPKPKRKKRRKSRKSKSKK